MRILKGFQCLTPFQVLHLNTGLIIESQVFFNKAPFFFMIRTDVFNKLKQIREKGHKHGHLKSFVFELFFLQVHWEKIRALFFYVFSYNVNLFENSYQRGLICKVWMSPVLLILLLSELFVNVLYVIVEQLFGLVEILYTKKFWPLVIKIKHDHVVAVFSLRELYQALVELVYFIVFLNFLKANEKRLVCRENCC